MSQHIMNASRTKAHGQRIEEPQCQLLSTILVIVCVIALGACADGGSVTSTQVSGVGVWSELEPSGDVPLGGSLVEVVYDPESGKLIACGEQHIFALGTWIVDPATGAWMEAAESRHAPSARGRHCFAYGTRSKQAILFGGLDHMTGEEIDDTWAYDLAADIWTDLDPAGDVPPGRSDAAMVYDEKSGRMILFGGLLADKAGESRLASVLAGDTWAYDPASNSWALLKATSGSPAPRFGHAMVYDSNSGKAIMFGGVGAQGDANDTWAYDPIADVWTELNPAGDVPTPRRGHRMVFDEASGKVVMFGGTVGYRDTNEMWIYDPATNEWSRVIPDGELPSPRSGHAMVSVPPSDTVVVLGGWGGSTGLLTDMWVYGGGK